jgi:hypothetical protein
MATRSASVLDHIADFLQHVSNVQAFWFTLDTSYDHGGHLSKRFRMSPDEDEMLLIGAGLASNGSHGFKMKPDAWSKFITGHRFVINDYFIDVVMKQMDIDAYINGTTPSRTNRPKKFYAIRIGNKTGQSADKIEDQRGRDGRLLTVPPRLNGLGMKCQFFQIDISALIWDMGL